MKDLHDLSKNGTYEYQKISSTYLEGGQTKSFSVNIYQWGLTTNGKRLKQLKCAVRVHGTPENCEKVYEKADEIVQQLNAGTYTGKSTVRVTK